MFEFYEIQHFSGSGNGWLETLLGGLIGALISAGIAWYISRKNLDDQRQLELERRNNVVEAARLNRNRFLSDQLSYFIELLESVVKDKIDTYEKNQTYIENYESNPLGYHFFKLEINGNLPRLHQFETLTIKDAVTSLDLKHDASLIYRKLINAIDYYKMHSSKLESERSLILDDWQQIVALVQKEVNELRAELAHMIYDIRENHVDGAKEKYLELFDSLRMSYIKGITKNNASDLSYHRAELVKKILISTQHDNRVYGYYPEFFRRAKRTDQLFSNLETKGREIAAVIGRVDFDLKEVNDEIVEIIQTHFNPDFLKSPTDQPK
jgi:hypothetical protein